MPTHCAILNTLLGRTTVFYGSRIGKANIHENAELLLCSLAGIRSRIEAAGRHIAGIHRGAHRAPGRQLTITLYHAPLKQPRTFSATVPSERGADAMTGRNATGLKKRPLSELVLDEALYGRNHLAELVNLELPSAQGYCPGLPSHAAFRHNDAILLLASKG